MEPTQPAFSGAGGSSSRAGCSPEASMALGFTESCPSAPLPPPQDSCSEPAWRSHSEAFR